jgi:myo-inositol 2-dehydrogenase/D-chiro-inositol 1-dehydrogenase
METIDIGIIGVGGMGSFHARTLAGLAGVRVRAISDPSEPNARAIHDELGAEIVTDPFELAASPDIAGLVIASPDATHPEFAIAALDRATPTLCEKPLATSIADAGKVVDAEVANGRRTIQLGFMREYDPAHRQVMAELATLGRIDAVRAVHRNSNASPRPIEQIVGQSLVHDIHSLRFMTGAEITSVHASGSGASNGSFRHVVALCTLSSGAHAILEFDDGGFAYEVGVEVLAAGGDALTGLPTRAVRRVGGSIDVHLGTDWFGWFAEAYRVQDQAWVESIRTGVATGPTTWDGFVAQLVVDATLASLATGRTVEPVAPERPAIYD